MLLFLDNRERHLEESLNIPHEVVQLDIGDVVIKDDQGTPICIIERKTVADLAASIKDGRYKEQKIRLMSHAADTNAIMIYIIEGKMSFNENAYAFGLSNKSIISAIINTQLRDKVHVFHTNSLIDTANCIECIWKRLEKLRLPSRDGGAATSIEDKYAELVAIKPQKKANMTQDIVLLSQLSSIPGISSKKAQLVVDHFKCKSIFTMMKSVQFNAEKFEQELLSIHGIGKAIAKSIKEHLFSEN